LGSLVDDNGFQIVTASGQVLRRKDRNIMSAEMFGAIGGQDINPVLNNMVLASKTFNIQEAYIPHPLNKTDYTGTGGSVADVTDG
ncbi:phage tail fiber protein, partial [Klebsiella pneumoniae]|nr:phage tail fiber protein [Klebsiella pneumoniae]